MPLKTPGFFFFFEDLERTEGIRVNCVCPAFTDTRMVRGSFGRADLAVNPTARLARSMGTIRWVT